MSDKCTNEKARFEAAQEDFASVKVEYDESQLELQEAKRAYENCMNQGSEMSIYTIFDMQQRIRNNGGTGSGNVIAEDENYYFIETNHHVAGEIGRRNVVDFWLGGDLVKSGVPAIVIEAYFKARNSVDISVLRVKKSDVGLSIPVVAPATDANGYNPAVGDQAFFGACAEGLWPRPRSGNILDVRGGLIYYEPNAIGGDSGSPIVKELGGRLYCIGRTAWSTRVGNKWVGLGMTWKRIEQIKRGEVSAHQELPPETVYPNEIEIQDDKFKGL